MVHLLVTIIALIAIVAVVLWFISKVNIPPPIIYVVYAGIAIFCILVIVWVLDSFGGAALRLQ